MIFLGGVHGVGKTSMCACVIEKFDRGGRTVAEIGQREEVGLSLQQFKAEEIGGVQKLIRIGGGVSHERHRSRSRVTP